MSKVEREKYILEAPIDEIFYIKKPHFQLPESARIFNIIICEKCREGVPENKIRLSSGKKLCLDCYEEYSRGW